MKKLLNETIIYGIGAILPRVIYFLLNPFFIYYISREEFAQFTNLYAWMSYINILLTLGFETSFFRYSAEKENENKAFYTSFWFLFFTASLFLGGVYIFNQSIADSLGYATHPEYIKWFAWIAFFDTICVIPLAWLRFNNKPIKYSAIRVAQVLVQVLSVLALFLFVPKETSQSLGMETSVSYAFVSNIIASVVAFVMLLPVVSKVRFKFSMNLFKRMIKYSYPLMLAGLAFVVNENFDKTVQYNIISKAEAGAYGGCYKLAVLMTLFVTAYRMGIEPFFFKQMNNANAPKTYAKITEYFTLFASVAALGIVANIRWLKSIFITDSSYWIAMDIVPIIVVGNLCFGIYYNLSTWYKVTDRTFVGTLISWLGAAITTVLNLVLLKDYGFMVSAWVTLLVYFLMMLVSYFLGQKYYPIPYNMKKIMLVLLLLSVFSFLSYQIFEANVWIGNILFLIFVFGIIFSERHLLSSLLDKFRVKN
ncbi:lipopolysaccharide biosynthesis protein [Riemerella anatipestifer]|uniref:lipopolysaccharide biosynthesis protein n=1 Tax=Riemerella anatipestifer TaxID=34085 RepID=UPI0023647349|nr:oligosaccharide flippase family protein [Riemerella anatipestifer]MDD1524766.1 oligosaccharide flippase family protein [Riemerella anatipestifer]